MHVCRARKAANRQIHDLQDFDTQPPQTGFESILFETIHIESLKQGNSHVKKEVYATVDIQIRRSDKAKTSLKAKLDTGAQGNVLPLRLYRQMFPQHIDLYGSPRSGTLEESNRILVAYGGTQIKHLGVATVTCTYKRRSVQARFYVTDTPGPAILGLPTTTDLDLLRFNLEIKEDTSKPTTDCVPTQQVHSTNKSTIMSKEDLLIQYPDCFNGIGKFKGKYHITLDPSIPPVVHPPRRVPISLKDDVKSELDEMVDNDIIEKIKEGEPTAWVNSLVYRRKANGRLRLCLDPKDLNEAILREHHTTSTLQEILPKLTGAKLFSIVDVKCGYWNVELDEESSFLTTFNSPFGRYRFRRMPFGLKMSQDIFQTRIDQTFEGCEGVVGIADDIVIFGKDEEDHDAHMHGMMKRSREAGIKLNPDKCFIKRESIKFYGIICGPDGIKPDPGKVSALKQMNPPTNKQELQTFLGMANYMAPFIPSLSTLTAPLRELVKQSSQFTWNATYQSALDKIKESISDEITLTYFDPAKETVLQVDASMRGLGAALLQDHRPVAFASKALNDVESRYANIERELLAVVYGCERFHTYLFGRSFTVHSDHKPLESIHLKHLTSAPPRLQRMLLRLQPYNLVIQYKPGREMEIADALSRLSPEEKHAIPDMNVGIHQICPQFSSNMIERIKVNTSTDSELAALKEQVYQGWPTSIKEVPQILRPYWSYRDEISMEDGILMKGHRIIIPKAIQSETLVKLHASHQGTEKTKLRARSAVYWRDLNKDIDEITKSCEICQELQKSQQKEPLIQTEVPPRPWHTIATDLFYLNGEEYLLIADYYSKFPFVRKLPKQSTSRSVIEQMKQIFSEHGVPKVVRSDNGPHYDAQVFKDFAEQYDFQHITSSPHYPQSNGFIEAQVNAAKKALLKAQSTKTDPYMALLCLRATPIDCKLPSPAEILLGRPIQDNLPRKLKRSTTSEEVIGRLKQRQEQQKQYHDRSSKVLPTMLPGQKVNIQDPVTQRWTPSTVKEKIDAVPRSYEVTSTTGRLLRRNRRHIRERASVSTEVKQGLSQSPAADPVSNADPPIPVPQAPKESQVTTRSGRTVKPPNRYGFQDN
jgi:transposase InsO family protein